MQLFHDKINHYFYTSKDIWDFVKKIKSWYPISVPTWNICKAFENIRWIMYVTLNTHIYVSLTLQRYQVRLYDTGRYMSTQLKRKKKIHLSSKKLYIVMENIELPRTGGRGNNNGVNIRRDWISLEFCRRSENTRVL